MKIVIVFFFRGHLVVDFVWGQAVGIQLIAGVRQDYLVRWKNLMNSSAEFRTIENALVVFSSWPQCIASKTLFVINNALSIDSWISLSTIPTLIIEGTFNLNQTSINRKASIWKIANPFQPVSQFLPFIIWFWKRNKSGTHSVNNDI